LPPVQLPVVVDRVAEVVDLYVEVFEVALMVVERVLVVPKLRVLRAEDVGDGLDVVDHEVVAAHQLARGGHQLVEVPLDGLGEARDPEGPGRPARLGLRRHWILPRGCRTWGCSLGGAARGCARAGTAARTSAAASRRPAPRLRRS